MGLRNRRRSVGVEIVAVMAQSNVADPKAVIHAENACAVGDLVEALDANQTGDATGVED